jgi:hypothetical protein
MAHGSEDLKKKFLPKLVSGEWTGTMCLTEPQCGSDLAQVRTKAVPSADGTYKVTGKHIQKNNEKNNNVLRCETKMSRALFHLEQVDIFWRVQENIMWIPL